MNLNLNQTAVFLSFLALLGAIYSFWKIGNFNKLRKTFFAGTQAKDLEEVIISLQKKLAGQERQQAALKEALAQLEHNSTFSVQKVGLVRFNPFQDGGGNFSFSLALLNAHNTGVIITSMHGREQNRIYTKKVTGSKSDTPLTEEEQQAVANANVKE